MVCAKIFATVIVSTVFSLLLINVGLFIEVLKPLLLLAKALFGIDVGPLVVLLYFIILSLFLVALMDIVARGTRRYIVLDTDRIRTG